MTVEVLLRKLDPELPTPEQAHPGDAGFDLRSRIDVVLAPGQRASVPTGVAIALPRGYVGLVTPRSGLARESGVGMVNAPGVIDAGYRGEVSVLLINHDPTGSIRLGRGDRIGQLVVLPIPPVRLVEVESLPGSDRGGRGFGSSGR
ncbi:MAG: dUTP diphosphatase [Actinobacteria bacterium]|nr:dUTP diphosphatase [Actinomycetota bacterium]MCB9412733.1 dUTP diphosphatase [Actinomycetota bacterium]